MASYYEDSQITTSAKFIATAASLVLCWIIFKVKMKRCERTVSNTAALLQPLQKAATAVETRRRTIKAASLTVEKALAEYKILLTMLHETPEADFDRDDFPLLPQLLEEDTIKAQLKMVKDCLTAASTEFLKTLPESAADLRQGNVLSSLYEQGQLVMTISEEILTALDSRKKMLKTHALRDHNSPAPLFDEYLGSTEWPKDVVL